MGETLARWAFSSTVMPSVVTVTPNTLTLLVTLGEHLASGMSKDIRTLSVASRKQSAPRETFGKPKPLFWVSTRQSLGGCCDFEAMAQHFVTGADMFVAPTARSKHVCLIRSLRAPTLKIFCDNNRCYQETTAYKAYATCNNRSMISDSV
jgi:hypothetical protein